MEELNLIDSLEYLIYRSPVLEIFFKSVLEICTSIVTLAVKLTVYWVQDE